jgi:hypothetical protein
VQHRANHRFEQRHDEVAPFIEIPRYLVAVEERSQ